MANAYVQAFGLKAFARVSITFSTPGIGRARLWFSGGGPVSDGTGQWQETVGGGLTDLYRKHAAWLTRRLRRSFGDEAEDLVQEAYLRLARLPSDQAVLHPRALLMRVASNLGLDHLRRVDRHKALSEEASSPSAGLDEAERLAVKSLVLSLPDDVRDVFVLSKVVGLTYEEIAVRTGLSVKAVEWRLSRAMIQCAAKLRP